MSQTYTYQFTDTATDQVFIDLLDCEIEKSVLTGYIGHQLLDEIYLHFEAAVDKPTLDAIVAAHDHTNLLPYPLVMDEVMPAEKQKEATAINYKTELKSGVTLHPVFDIDYEGFLEETIRYKTFVAGTGYSDPIIKIVETYTVNNDSSVNSAKSVASRTKEWFYMMSDGNWANAGDSKGYKIKSKVYTNITQIRTEGKRRRNNILDRLSIQLATILMFNGQAADQQAAEDFIIALLETHEIAVATWIKSGRGTVYADILADASLWLTSTVPASVIGINFVEASALGLTLDVYITERLSGNL